MEKTHYSKRKFLEKELFIPFQVNESFLHPFLTLKRLGNVSNPFRFQVVLEMKYSSEMDYIIRRLTFVWSSFLDFKCNSFLSNHVMKELVSLSRLPCMQNINIDQESYSKYIFHNSGPFNLFSLWKIIVWPLRFFYIKTNYYKA